MSKSDPIDLLAHFLEQQTEISAEDGAALVRMASEGKPFTLPEPTGFYGEVARAKLTKIFKLEPSRKNSSSTNSSPLPDSERATAIRALAGPELAASAEVLIASGRSVTEAAAILASVRATAPSKAPARIPTIAERMAGLPEMGGEFMPPPSSKERAAAGWNTAFKQAEAKREGQITIGGSGK